MHTDKLIAAVEWLVENHHNWKDIDLNEMRRNLEGCKPVFVNNSTEAQSSNSNIEEEELLHATILMVLLLPNKEDSMNRAHSRSSWKN